MDASGAALLGGGSRLDLDTLARVSGMEFCQALAAQLAAVLAADLVTVGMLHSPQGGPVRVLAGCFDGLPLEEFDYDSSGTPCLEVVRSGNSQVIRRQVPALYPEAGMFREEGIQAYAGAALTNAEGEVTGVLQAAWRREIGTGLAQQAAAVMERFAPRLGAEIAGLQRFSALAALAGDAEGRGPRAAFGQLAQQLQGGLRVRAAFIAETLEDRPECFRVLGCCVDGQEQAGAAERILPFEGLPCARLQGREHFLVPQGLQAAFPAQAAFPGGRQEAYLGVPLRDADGTVIGHFALLHDRALSPRKLETGLIALFAARIARVLRRRRAERRQEWAAQAQLISLKAESLGLLAGTVAHDFNNLLAAAQGQADLALAHLEAGHPAQQHVQGVGQGLQASAELVRQLLSFARGGAGQPPDRCDLNGILRETMALLPVARITNKTVVLDLAAEALMARLDPAQVRQLVTHLVFNAIEAIGSGEGTVTVLARRCCPGAEERGKLLKGRSKLPEGACLLLEVRDTGAGMGRETVTRIFDPFFSTKPGGRGLGLAAVLGVVSSHRGGLAVDSCEGGGSSFRVYFPACGQPAAQIGRAHV